MDLIFFMALVIVLIYNIFRYKKAIKNQNELLVRQYNKFFSSDKNLDEVAGIYNAGLVYYKTSIKCFVLVSFSFIFMRLLFSLQLSNLMQIVAYFIIFTVILVTYILLLNNARVQVKNLVKK